MSDWRPIESAPYGRKFVAEREDTGEEVIVVRYLFARQWGDDHAVISPEIKRWWTPARWRHIAPHHHKGT